MIKTQKSTTKASLLPERSGVGRPLKRAAKFKFNRFVPCLITSQKYIRILFYLSEIYIVFLTSLFMKKSLNKKLN